MPEVPMIPASTIYAQGVESDITYDAYLAICEVIFPDPGGKKPNGGPAPRTRRERLAHFLSLIGPPDPVTGCREWQGSRIKTGYGQFAAGRLRGKCINVRAHRLMYQLVHGLVPDDLQIRHKCDNPPCCNPDHLETGTAYDNIQDSVQRGRRNYAKERPGAWRLPPEVRRKAIHDCLNGPRGTTARLARELGVPLAYLNIAVARARKAERAA